MFEEGKSQEVGRAGRDGLISRCTLYHYGARRWTGPTAVCMEICSGKNTYVKQQNTHWTPGFPGFLAKKKDVGAEIGNIIGEKNIFFLANKGKDLTRNTWWITVAPADQIQPRKSLGMSCWILHWGGMDPGFGIPEHPELGFRPLLQVLLGQEEGH